LQPVRTLRQGHYLAALAVFFGDTRLIDNTTLEIAQ
ncbi:MAG: pantoate--beta-alanine ligase, partial [Bacteroidetes bacterium]|nr:pantoate--beta-alanine ligase [Bacteroidota bacterium]